MKYPDAPLSGKWLLVRMGGPAHAGSAFCKERVVWEFLPSAHSEYCGKLLVSSGGIVVAESFYCCRTGSLTVFEPEFLSAEDDFDMRICLFHYRENEGHFLTLDRLDIQNGLKCRSVGYDECIVKYAETFIFQPPDAEYPLFAEPNL